MNDDVRRVRQFSSALAGDLVNAAHDALVGVYLHGSAVLGDWNGKVSDVDVLVIVGDACSPSLAKRLAAVLSSDRDCAGAGLEASVVTARAAAAPTEPWPFVVHVNTTRPDRRTVWGYARGGDSDLVLHYAVARASGWAAHGPPPDMVIGPVAYSTVIDQLVDELRWAVEHASQTYAILNACRALRYRDERVLCSKTEGGTWALARHLQPALVQRALEERRLGLRAPVTDRAARWVLAVAEDLNKPDQVGRV